MLLDDSKDAGRSTLVREPKNRSFTFSCGAFYDGFEGLPTFVKPWRLNYLRNAVHRVVYALDNSFSSKQRRLTIRQRYFAHLDTQENFTRKQAIWAMNELGATVETAEAIVKHWDETTEITSSSGPHTLAEWRLYERAKKLNEGGFSYRDAVGMLTRDAGIPSKQVKDIIGTSEEWRLGYWDDGLRLDFTPLSAHS